MPGLSPPDSRMPVLAGRLALFRHPTTQFVPVGLRLDKRRTSTRRSHAVGLERGHRGGVPVLGSRKGTFSSASGLRAARFSATRIRNFESRGRSGVPGVSQSASSSAALRGARPSRPDPSVADSCSYPSRSSLPSFGSFPTGDNTRSFSSFAEPAEAREQLAISATAAVTGDRAAAAQHLVNKPLAQLIMQDERLLVVL